MPSARAELNAVGNGRSSGSAALQKHLRSQCASHMKAHSMTFKAVADRAGVDSSNLGKFMRGAGMSLNNLVRLESIFADSNNDSASDLAGLSDAIACRLLQGDGCISKHILTRYENEVCR